MTLPLILRVFEFLCHFFFLFFFVRALYVIFVVHTLNTWEHAHVNSYIKEPRRKKSTNVQRNTRVTFIMTGQISKHKHITTMAHKNGKDCMKAKREICVYALSVGGMGKSECVHGLCWPLVTRTNKRLCIDLMETNEGGKNNICIYFMISCVFIILRVISIWSKWSTI